MKTLCSLKAVLYISAILVVINIISLYIVQKEYFIETFLKAGMFAFMGASAYSTELLREALLELPEESPLKQKLLQKSLKNRLMVLFSLVFLSAVGALICAFYRF